MEKSDLEEIEVHEIPPARVIAEDEEPTIVPASEQPHEPVETFGALEEHQLEAAAVVDEHPIAESAFTESENIEETEQTAKPVEEEDATSPANEEGIQFIVFS
jgi:hypothetical protein